jgi:type III restriction enzyme
MKFKFKQQQYQADATNAVIRCFLGQVKGKRQETVRREVVDNNLFGKQEIVSEIFSNKKLDITEEELLRNIKEIQKENGISPISNQIKDFNFTIEMETGTGKTYVYTKTMFELNKQYGWNKFIIMVPSVAIREGVHKSLQITTEHFQEIYGKKIRFSIYNTKNKSNLVNIKSFANTSNIEVIIMNYQAFGRKSKESLKIYQKLDTLQSEKPIDIIKRARPILIIDEPQRFGPNAEEMLKEFNPLFKLRYSATHKEDYNKIYRLDAIDAFNQKLVKKINVKGIEVVSVGGTDSYLFLDKINISSKTYPTANIELEIKQENCIKKHIRNIKEGDDLFIISNGLAQYKKFLVKEINGLNNKVCFTNGVEITVGQCMGDVDEKHIRRIQIRETIKSHLEKERLMYKQGIKVLSLFFIDQVAKYRQYDENGNQLEGEYEKIFEEEYNQAISQKTLFDSLDEDYQEYLNKFSVKKIHKGYFSIDKKGKFVDSKEKSDESGSDDESAYDLIMKNKEKLLSFSESTRFIFSHSALREGWDNPNVFQICTLRHAQAEISKRQEIGRGLRICVNENGERMDYSFVENDFFNFNTLTVIANEAYDTFAKTLQKEILDTLTDRPIELTAEVLKDRVLKNKEGQEFIFNNVSAQKVVTKFTIESYIDEDLKITQKLINDIEDDKLIVPVELENFKEELGEVMRGIYLTANFKSSANEKSNNITEEKLNPNENFHKKEFQDLWKKIKTKTSYEVNFNSNELIKKSTRAINHDDGLRVKKIVVNITEGTQGEKLDEESLRKGISIKRTRRQRKETENILSVVKYDLIAEITERTKLTRKTIVEILKNINENKFYQFKLNPEDFIRQVANIINQQKAATLIQYIVYSKIDQFYSDEIFTINNFNGSLKENILEVKKHIYDYVKTDSKIERTFAEELETGDVLVYAKLPNGFKIPTPVGNYNPDWAIVFDKKDVKYIYFIAETKGSMDSMQLKLIEDLKIKYARKHFEALGEKNVKYDMVDSYKELMDKVMK